MDQSDQSKHEVSLEEALEMFGYRYCQNRSKNYFLGTLKELLRDLSLGRYLDKEPEPDDDYPDDRIDFWVPAPEKLVALHRDQLVHIPLIEVVEVNELGFLRDNHGVFYHKGLNMGIFVNCCSDDADANQYLPECLICAFKAPTEVVPWHLIEAKWAEYVTKSYRPETLLGGFVNVGLSNTDFRSALSAVYDRQSLPGIASFDELWSRYYDRMPR